jgi:beta-apo-4'-carotenal oxygenase
LVDSTDHTLVLHNITSGGASLNDAFMHGSVPTLPFGGVGSSGTGSYRGKASFDCFTHRRTVAETPSWVDKLLRVRYPPYLPSELKRFQWMNRSTPDFDRDGNKISGVSYWTWMILGLGGQSGKGALLRWLLVFAGSYAMLKGLYLRRADARA